MRSAIWMLGLSFIGAAIATALLFEGVDPVGLQLLGRVLGVSGKAFYIAGGAALWLLIAGVGGLFWFLRRPAERDGDSARYRRRRGAAGTP